MFTMSGLYDQRVPPFDLFSLGESACRSNGDLRARADGFLATAFPQVAAVVGQLATTDPSYLRQSFEGKPVIEVLFIGIYRGHLSIFARGAVLENGRLKKETDEAVSGDDGFFSGANDHIIAYIGSHPGWRKHGVVIAVRHLVELEADAHPDLVGGPISVLTVDGRGKPRWIDKGKCEAD
jgi:hypothetical protein